MVKNRYMTLLSTFNDLELAKGIEEIKTKYADRTVLEFTDRFVFLVANKR